MADRRTRYAKGLKNITFYGTTTLGTGATFAGTSKASVEAMVCGIASGDTSYDNLKVACGQCIITGSRDIDTGMTTVISGGANISNTTGGVSNTPQYCQVRIRRNSGGEVSGLESKSTHGWMKIVCKGISASVEAATAASVDWFAIGT